MLQSELLQGEILSPLYILPSAKKSLVVLYMNVNQYKCLTLSLVNLFTVYFITN